MSGMKKIFAFLVVLALAGCAGHKDDGFVCPETGFMENAAAAAFFAQDVKKPKPADVSVYAVLRNLKGSCSLTRKNSTEITLRFDAVAQKTAAGKGVATQKLSYFIAILDKNDDILQRASFYTTVGFAVNKADTKNSDAGDTGAGDTGVSTEEHTVDLPLAKPEDILKHRIVIGFMLTPEQLAFNRAHYHDFNKN